MTPIACLPPPLGRWHSLDGQMLANLAQLTSYATKKGWLLLVKRQGVPSTSIILAFSQKTSYWPI
jgi:hypothetical protein